MAFGCSKLNLPVAMPYACTTSMKWHLWVPQSSVVTTEMRGVNRYGRGGGECNWNNNSDWHGWSWPTRVTLTVGSSCCPPSLPPSCLTQLMSKLGSVQRRQCGEGEITMLDILFVFGVYLGWEPSAVTLCENVIEDIEGTVIVRAVGSGKSNYYRTASCYFTKMQM